jgi:hypothetical protein
MRSIARTAVVAIGILSCASAALAQFTPPADGKLTDKQVVNYLAVLKDHEKMTAALAQFEMSGDEYDWIDKQFKKLAPLAAAQQLKEQTSRLATYQQAQKDGKRVLNPAQHNAATQAAGADLDSANQTVVDAAANIKQISDEVAAHDKDVADDEAQAKNPPANLTGDDLSNYIDGRKNDAQAARDAATDARSRLKDAQKSLDDAKAALAAVQSKIDHPDVPVTDDEKAAVKKENDHSIADATATIDLDQKAIQSLKDAEPARTVDPDNLALVQKHIGDYLAAMVAFKPLDTK